MAYVINKFNGEELVVLEDGTINTTTSVNLVGRNYVGYGELQNENFVFLLENFANDAPPPRPLTGQIWFNTDDNSANVYDGVAWTPIGTAKVSDIEPENKNIGSLWLRTTDKTLQVWLGNSWAFIGPESLPGFGITRATSVLLTDVDQTDHPAILLTIDGEVIAVCSSDEYTLHVNSYITGISTSIKKGINLSVSSKFTGNVDGNASSANRLTTARTINGVPFDGQSNITIKSEIKNKLFKGNYIVGSNFDGSAEATWSVDATSANVIGTVVARDNAGDFSAGRITASFIGNLTGNVDSSSGTSYFDVVHANTFIGATLAGNSFTATKLETSRKINGINFDGTQDITVTASAATLTGDSLAPTIRYSSLTEVGTLTSLSTANLGITVGSGNEFKLFVESGSSTILTNSMGLKIQITDSNQNNGKADFSFIPTSEAVLLGAEARPAFVGDDNSTCNIGLPSKRFNTVYGVRFDGVSTTAEYADLAENYVADAEYTPGTVLEFGGNFEVTLAEDATNRVAGVVTTNPAYLMNSKCSGNNVVAIALQGRVPCKVKGDIKKGDMLISGGNGYARKAISPQIGTIIGKALSDFSGIEGVIEVAVGRI